VEDLRASRSQLSRVSTCASDRSELLADVDAVPASVGEPERVLADNGCANGDEVEKLESRELRESGREGRGLEVLVAMGRGGQKAEWLRCMAGKIGTEESRTYYCLRKQTVEPVLGIVKEAVGFRRVLLPGLRKVEGKWRG